MSGPIVTATGAGPLPGWYGKLPALGDFASRRLPPDFIGRWDAWLQRALLASRALLGERWPAAYLRSPIWRFVLLPGACGASCWAGLLLPSVDKVGRHFPLTIAVGLDPQPETVAGVFAADGWFEALEPIALAALCADAPPEQLDTALLATPYRSARSPACDTGARALGQWWSAAPCPPLSLSLPDADGVPGLLGSAALHALAASGAGRTLWWQRDQLAPRAALLAFCGMPPDDYASILLAGAQ